VLNLYVSHIIFLLSIYKSEFLNIIHSLYVLSILSITLHQKFTHNENFVISFILHSFQIIETSVSFQFFHIKVSFTLLAQKLKIFNSLISHFSKISHFLFFQNSTLSHLKMNHHSHGFKSGILFNAMSISFINFSTQSTSTLLKDLINLLYLSHFHHKKMFKLLKRKLSVNENIRLASFFVSLGHFFIWLFISSNLFSINSLKFLNFICFELSIFHFFCLSK